MNGLSDMIKYGPVRMHKYAPEEVGWQRIGPRIWEKPDGTRWIFSPNVREEVVKIDDIWPVHLADKLEQTD